MTVSEVTFALLLLKIRRLPVGPFRYPRLPFERPFMSRSPSRRRFLQTSAAAAAGTALFVPTVHAAGGDTLKIALVGCGGRGTGAAMNALGADNNVKLVAVADVFEDLAIKGLESMRAGFPDKVAVAPECVFSGFDAYKKAIDMADVVVMATPPGFRPVHFAYAVEKGKHVFMEKPHAVDVPGARSVLESAKLAKTKGLNVVSGFCYRYDAFKRETMKRIHGGAVGDVLAVHSNYLTGELWSRASKTNDPKEMETQLRMWYYYTWLSGDFLVEQAIHSVDKAAWVMNGLNPISAVGTGGRAARTDAKFGNIWDNFSIVYEYEGGQKVFLQCRQTQGCHGETNDHVMGTKGTAQVQRHTIKTGDTTWRPEGKHDFGFMYQVEHNELFAAIRSGKTINDAEASVNSTLMGLMGRDAAYTGQKLLWDKYITSSLSLAPKEYAMGENPVPAFAKPGKYKV